LFFSGPNGDLDLKTFSITSSAFYWPFFFADGDPGDFVHDSRLPGQIDTFEIEKALTEDERGLTMDYRAWNFSQEDNFCRVDVNQAENELIVRSYDSAGNLIVNRSGKPMEETLKLAEW